MSTDALVVLRHPRLGECRLEGVEGMNWLIRDAANRLLRIPVSRRGEFVAVSPSTPSVVGTAMRGTDRSVQSDQAVVGGTVVDTNASPKASTDKVRLRRMFEAIRTGLPPNESDLQHLAIGVEPFEADVSRFLEEVNPGNGAVRIIRGAYGQGKSFSLRLLQSHALEKGFLVARTEIDASENQLNKPNHVYRDLMRNLRIPGSAEQGPTGLAKLVYSHLYARRQEDISATESRRYLEQHIECWPLAWLFSDLRLIEKPELLGLLGADPNCPASVCRKAHIVPGRPQDWPHFTAGTQGDFASYVLSGISKLSRLLGFQGLIVIIDEMEKWQDLNWRAQTQAGNLVGGLIWAATGKEGNRQRGSYYRPNPSQPLALSHSLRCGGYPFTTDTPCQMGLVIAMTPRGAEGPEEMWRHYGPLEIFDLLSFTTADVRAYLARVAPDFCAAYDLTDPDIGALGRIAVQSWAARGDGSARSAVQSVVEALDAWRSSLNAEP